MSKRHVFLSYCNDNKAEVASLRDELIAADIAIWWDQDILAGEDKKQKIRMAVEQSFAFIVCLSSQSQSHPQPDVHPGLLHAIDAYRDKSRDSLFLIPVRLSECEIPLIEIDSMRTLKGLRSVDLFPDDSRTDNFNLLLRSLYKARDESSTPIEDKLPEDSSDKLTPSENHVREEHEINNCPVEEQEIPAILPRTLGDLWRIALVGKGRIKGEMLLNVIRRNLGKKLQNPLTELQATLQSSAFEGREHIIIAGPTSSGKTTVADVFLVFTALWNENRRSAIYIAPTRALAQAKHRDFQKILFGSELYDRLVLSTGEDSVNDWRLPKGEFSVAFLVYEKANILFSRPGSLLQRLGIIVVDEIHMLDDLDRGPTLDVTLAKILNERENIDSHERTRTQNDTLRIIAISTEDKPDETLANLLHTDDMESGEKIPPAIFRQNERPVIVAHNLILPPGQLTELYSIFPFREFKSSSDRLISGTDIAEIDGNLHVLRDTIAKNHPENKQNAQAELKERAFLLAKKLLESAHNGYRLLVFVPSKSDVEELGGRLVNERGIIRVNAPRLEELKAALQEDEDEEFRRRATRYASKGIYLHHADVPRTFREAVEKLCDNADDQLIPEAIISTETLAYGVNLAIADVILVGTTFRCTDRKGSSILDELSLSSFHNMTGRAGRLGKCIGSIAPQVYVVVPHNIDPMSIIQRYYTNIQPVRSRIFVQDDHPKKKGLLGRRLIEEGMPQKNPHHDRAKEVTYPFARSVLDLLRHQNFVGQQAGNQATAASVDNLLSLFDKTLYARQLLDKKKGEKEEDMFIASIEGVLFDCSAEPLELVKQPNNGLFIITERGEAIIDTGTEIQTVRTLLDAITRLENAWLEGVSGEESMPIMPTELFMISLLMQEEVYRTCIYATPECKRAIRHSTWPSEIRYTNFRIVDEKLKRSLDMCAVPSQFIDTIAQALRKALEESDVARVSGMYPRSAVDSVFRLFACIVDWIYGASQVDARAHVQKFGSDVKGSAYDGKRFSFVQLTERLRYKTVFLAKLLSGGRLRGANSSVEERRLFLLSERVRFGCEARAVPLFWPRASNMTRTEVGSLLDAEGDPSRILKQTRKEMAAKSKPGLPPKKKLEQLQKDLEKYAIDEFESLSVEMTYYEPDSPQKRSAQEFWAILSTGITSGYFQRAVFAYRNETQHAYGFSKEVSRILSWTRSGSPGDFGSITISDRRDRRRGDLEEGDPRLVLDKSSTKSDAVYWKLQRFDEKANSHIDQHSICIVAMEFTGDWCILCENEKKTIEDVIMSFESADFYIITALPWVPNFHAMPETSGRWLKDFQKSGRRLSFFTPAAFGAFFSLTTRDIIPDDCIIEIGKSPSDIDVNLVGVEQISEYIEERAENIPSAIREKLIRHFEVT